MAKQPIGVRDLLTVKALAAKLRVNPWRIYQAVRDGQIPYRRFVDRGKILLDLTGKTVCRWVKRQG